MGELSSKALVVTAFLSEGCDPCVKTMNNMKLLSQEYPEIIVLGTYDDNVMDEFGITMTPSIVVGLEDGEGVLTVEGLVEYSDLITLIESFISDS